MSIYTATFRHLQFGDTILFFGIQFHELHIACESIQSFWLLFHMTRAQKIAQASYMYLNYQFIEFKLIICMFNRITCLCFGDLEVREAANFRFPRHIIMYHIMRRIHQRILTALRSDDTSKQSHSHELFLDQQTAGFGNLFVSVRKHILL